MWRVHTAPPYVPWLQLHSYVVCSNNQHELASDIDPDPKKTSFYLAMLQSEGVLLLLDDEATPFTRIWYDSLCDACVFGDTSHLDVSPSEGICVHEPPSDMYVVGLTPS